MAWIESHQELRYHPKTKRFARALGVNLAEAIGHLHMLWWWTMDYAPDGDLSRYEDEDLADAADWEGDPTLLVAALSSAGFLEPTRVVHHWSEYGGKLHERRRQDALRKRLGRAADKEPASAGRPADLPRPSGVEERRGEKKREEDIHGGAAAPRARKAPAEAEKPPEESPERPRDVLFDAFVRNMHWDDRRLSSNDRGQINNALKALRPIGATAEEIDVAFEVWPRVFKDCNVTPPAVGKHFSTLMAAAHSNGHARAVLASASRDSPEAWRQPDGKLHPDAPEEIKAEWAEKWGLGSGRW